jgi:hypothetical protein
MRAAGSSCCARRCHDSQNCFTGLATVFSDSSATAHAALKQRLLADLTAAAAHARGVEPAAINATAMWWAALKGAPPSPQKAILSDPAFLRWQVWATFVSAALSPEHLHQQLGLRRQRLTRDTHTYTWSKHSWRKDSPLPLHRPG